MTTTTELTITIAPMTAAYVQETNQGNPLTDAAAQVIANAYNAAMDDRLADEYPDVAVDFSPLNGIDGFRVYGDDDEQVAEVERFIGAAADAIWQSPELWSLVSGCAYCSSDVCHAEGEPVPAVDDDEAWAALAGEHTSDCEWIATRAHNLAPA